MLVLHAQGITEFQPWRTSREGVETSKNISEGGETSTK